MPRPIVETGRAQLSRQPEVPHRRFFFRERGRVRGTSVELEKVNGGQLDECLAGQLLAFAHRGKVESAVLVRVLATWGLFPRKNAIRGISRYKGSYRYRRRRRLARVFVISETTQVARTIFLI